MAQAEPARGRTGKLAGGAGPLPTTSTAFADVILRPGALRTVFQPILRCSTTRWTLHALECLTRGPAGPYSTAASLFGAAGFVGGCTDYVVKPVDQLELRMKVEGWLDPAATSRGPQ